MRSRPQTIHALLALAAAGCLNPREAQCVKDVEVKEDLDLAKCAAEHGGICPEDMIDPISEPNDPKVDRCIDEN
jgi:hypothetical protein